MSLEILKDADKVIGAKQTIRAIEKSKALAVYLAGDADCRITNPIRDLCGRKGVNVVSVPLMHDLGKACGIAVGAAAVAVTKLKR